MWVSVVAQGGRHWAYWCYGVTVMLPWPGGWWVQNGGVEDRWVEVRCACGREWPSGARERLPFGRALAISCGSVSVCGQPNGLTCSPEAAVAGGAVAHEAVALGSGAQGGGGAQGKTGAEKSLN